ncbi:Putative DNA helicase, UvrD/REP type, DExx box DNA helicase domain superfamily [Septoria linicola]|uniref:DNA 3'-5' helicase n=1 Tax=Septoria linicola TaxID=215465 RepID=A0A9Q9EFP2_9PEZI|nr:putative DNA helicase, UvrD/REP type, DExx box DNA helicase domain superfamily [Septoria linicola]USW47448.1 Putative DNA helicase, UvrD/REP type, DExx box DNA helicase domain superfamily [Septoria linicola]
MDNILQGLNAAQRTAVASDSFVLQVLAPPGSGKTKTLTARVAYLIARRNLQPWNIIVCTFTVKAAKEMKDRITKFVGPELSRQLKLGTFHSVALRYLKTYGQHIGLNKDFGIADTSDQKAILKRIIKQLGLSVEPGPALGRISSRKVKGETEKKPKSVEQQDFARLFNEYEATLAASNLLDYDDILLRCTFLLRSHPQCVANVQAVLIDEFQDTNNIQYDLMKLFAQKQNVITIVGDPDQSIYGFRAAEIKNLSRMRTQWPDTLTINLEENYRSSGAILHAAQNIIEQDESRPPKRLQATHSFGLRPVLRKLPSAAAEAEWLVSEIRRIRSLSGAMMDLGDFAILLRSAALSRVIETALGNAGLAYRMVGGMRFYDRVEVKLVVDYLRVVHQPDNSEAVERILNVPSRHIGEATIKKLREEAQSKGLSLWSLVLANAQGRCKVETKLMEKTQKGLALFVDVILSGRRKVDSWTNEKQELPSVADVITSICQKIKLQAYLKDKFQAEETYEARWSNIEELTAQAAEISRLESVAHITELESLPVLEDIDQRARTAEDALSIFLDNIALTASAEKKADEEIDTAQQITISTIHAAKGLEWPVVFIPACYNGSIPHSRADDNDEERRLLYVGMTRAKALLYLSCPVKNSQREVTDMSIFLTHSGVGSFFEEHGPSLALSAIENLSSTLGKACPDEQTLSKAGQKLERDEDNYWPVNGEEPYEELGKWNAGRAGSLSTTGFTSVRAHNSSSYQQNLSTDTATIPPQQGFVSVAARYDELIEQAEARKLEKRVAEEQQKQTKVDPATVVPKGRKRQIEGQGNIANFFQKGGGLKKQKSAVLPEEGAETAAAGAIPSTARKGQPLQEIPNLMQHNSTNSFMTARQTGLPTHRPRSTPMAGKPGAQHAIDESENSSAQQEKYVFLSSSPAKAEEERPTQPAVTTTSSFQPASTLHTTSVEQAAARPTQRRTLGVKRSFNGWAARMNR